MRGRAAMAVAAPVLLAAASVVLAAITVSFEGGFRPSKAGTREKSLPITDFLDLTIADDTGAQPSPLRKVVTHHDVPVVFNGKFFPRCKRFRLEHGGPAACPPGSRVGVGTATG